MAICPNKNHPEYKALENEYGEMGAMYAWFKHGRSGMPTVEQGAKYLGKGATAMKTASLKYDALMESISDKFNPVWKAIGGKTDINGKLRTAYTAAQDFIYKGSSKVQFMQDLEVKVQNVLKKAQVPLNELSEIMFHTRRIALEGYKDIKDTAYGFTKNESEMALAEQRQRLDPEQYAALKEAQKNFQTVWQDNIVAKLEGSGLVDADRLAAFKRNPEYAKFKIILDEAIENASVTSPDMVKKLHEIQGYEKKRAEGEGPSQAVEDVYASSIIEGSVLLDVAARNKAAKEMVRAIVDKEGLGVAKAARLPDTFRMEKDYTTGEVLEVKQPPQFAPPKAGMERIAFRNDGKIEAWDVPEAIGKLYNYDPKVADSATKLILEMTDLSRQLLTGHNVAFQIPNLIRDVLGTAKRLGTDFVPFVLSKKGIESYKQTFRAAMGNTDEYVSKMMRDGKLIAFEQLSRESSGDLKLGESPIIVSKDPNFLVKLVQQYWKYTGILGQTFEHGTKIAADKWLRGKNPTMSEAQLKDIIRMQAGSPSFLTKGGSHSLTNTLFVYSNAIMQGYKSDIAAFGKDPSGYAKRALLIDVLPKIITLSIGAGLLNDVIPDGDKIVKGIDSRTLRDYHVMPLFIDADGKSHFLKFPQTEAARPLLAAMHDAVRGGDITDTMASLLGDVTATGPSYNPLISISQKAGQFIQQGNAYDTFRGRMMIPKKVQEAGGREYAAAVIDSMLESMGLKNIVGKPAGMLEQAVSGRLDDKTTSKDIPLASVLTSALGRFYSTSERGVAEDIQHRMKSVTQEQAVKLRDKRRFIQDAVKDKMPIQDIRAGLIKQNLLDKDVTPKRLEGQVKFYQSREQHDAWLDALSGTNEHKESVVQEYRKDHTKKETMEYLKTARSFGMISKKNFNLNVNKFVLGGNADGED